MGMRRASAASGERDMPRMPRLADALPVPRAGPGREMLLPGRAPFDINISAVESPRRFPRRRTSPTRCPRTREQIRHSAPPPPLPLPFPTRAPSTKKPPSCVPLVLFVCRLCLQTASLDQIVDLFKSQLPCILSTFDQHSSESDHGIDRILGSELPSDGLLSTFLQQPLDQRPDKKRMATETKPKPAGLPVRMCGPAPSRSTSPRE